MIVAEELVAMTFQDLDDANQGWLGERLLCWQRLDAGALSLDRVGDDTPLDRLLGGGSFNELCETNGVARFPIAQLLVRHPNRSKLSPRRLSRDARHYIHVEIAGVLDLHASILLDGHVAVAVAVSESLPNQPLHLLWIAVRHLLKLTHQIHIEFLAVDWANCCSDANGTLRIHHGSEAMERRVFLGKEFPDRFITLPGIAVLGLSGLDGLADCVEHL